MPFTLSTLELSGCPTHDHKAPFKIIHTLIKIQIFRLWAGQKWWCLEELPSSHWGHQQDTSLKQQILPRDREIWLRFSLQTTKFYFNSLQSLEHVQEFTAVSADVLSPPPWLYTSFKNKMTLFLGIQRVTNHNLHTKLQLLHNPVIWISLCVINKLCRNKGEM